MREAWRRERAASIEPKRWPARPALWWSLHPSVYAHSRWRTTRPARPTQAPHRATQMLPASVGGTGMPGSRATATRGPTCPPRRRPPPATRRSAAVRSLPARGRFHIRSAITRSRIAVPASAAVEFEGVYLANLPNAEMYEQSYMHRDTVTHVAACKQTGFFITGRCAEASAVGRAPASSAPTPRPPARTATSSSGRRCPGASSSSSTTRRTWAP